MNNNFSCKICKISTPTWKCVSSNFVRNPSSEWVCKCILQSLVWSGCLWSAGGSSYLFPPTFFFFLKWGCRKWNRSWFRGTDLAYPFHPFWADTHADFTVWELTYYQVINDTVGKSLGLANQLLLNCWRHYFFWIRTFDSPCPGIRIEADSIGMVLSNRNFALEFIHSDHAI